MEENKKLRIIRNLPQRTEEELIKSANSIRYFLNKVHPTLLDGTDGNAGVCILPIQRDTKDGMEYNYALNKPLTIWKWGEKTEELLLNLLKRINGKPVDLYYSVFNYNPNKESINKDGKETKKGHMNADRARYSMELFLDFDNCSKEDFNRYREMFNSIGLEVIWIFSGHGYQCHILLSEKNWKEENNLLKLMYVAKSKGMDVDTTCVDPARKSRLPQWTNYKCYDQDKYEHERANPPKTFGLSNTDKRYTVAEVLSKLSVLETTNREWLEEYNKISKKLEIKSEEQEEIKEVNYRYIKLETLPKQVEKMLTETCREGIRNATMGFLIRYFKNYLKMDKEQVHEDLNIWHNLIVQGVIDNFNKDFNRLWNRDGLDYTSELAKIYGYLDFTDIVKVKVDRDILIPNALIDTISLLDKGAIKIYLAIKMVEHLEMESSIENIVNLSGLTKRTVCYGLEILIKKQHVYVTKANRKNGQVYIYNTQKIIDINKGYTVLTYDNIKCMIAELKNNSIKLYLYMLRRCFNNKYCTLNQVDLANAIGVKRNTITAITKDLEENLYIKIEKKQIKKNIESNAYILKR